MIIAWFWGYAIFDISPGIGTSYGFINDSGAWDYNWSHQNKMRWSWSQIQTLFGTNGTFWFTAATLCHWIKPKSLHYYCSWLYAGESQLVAEVSYPPFKQINIKPIGKHNSLNIVVFNIAVSQKPPLYSQSYFLI